MSPPEPVDVLFTEYLAAQRSGEFDPRPYLDRADPADREILVTMIDAYLSKAPGRQWDPEAFKGSRAEALVQPMARSLSGVSGTWPVLLPSLRHRARLRRSEVVAKLASGLGYPKKSDRVGEYYHGMERGQLEADRVSGKVLEVLSDVLGTGVKELRTAGQSIDGGKLKSGSAVFARQPIPYEGRDGPAEQTFEDRDEAMVKHSLAMPDAEELAIDELFTGGS
jgi:hypothetical protein